MLLVGVAVVLEVREVVEVHQGMESLLPSGLVQLHVEQPCEA